MSDKSVVELADRKSRLRAVLFAVAAAIFALVQVITRPTFAEASTIGWRRYAWVVNAVFLLLCFVSGGFLLNNTRVRALMNDEVSINNYRTGCVAGFWTVVVAGLMMYVVPSFQSFTGQQVIWILVTLGTTISMLAFSGLEYRAHGDA